MVLGLHRRLATPGAATHRLWGLRLANRARCTAAQGATGIYHGKPVDFYCTKSFSVVGKPDRSAAMWRAHVIEKVRRHWRDRGWINVPTGWYARSTPR